MPQKSLRKTWESETLSELRQTSTQQEAQDKVCEEPRDGHNREFPRVAELREGQERAEKPAKKKQNAPRGQLKEEAGRMKKKHTRIGQMEAEQKQQDMLIGQLKAAEARNRIRQFRLRYQNIRAKEISLMVSCQATAQNAIRLQCLLPVIEDKGSKWDTLDRLQRRRVEELMDDDGERFLTRC